MPMPDDFLLRVGLAAVGIAVVSGPLGCFVLWRRMVFFGDTISHAALLGVAFALALSLPVLLGVLLAATGVSTLILLSGDRFHHTDTLLGVAAHSALAMGLVAVSLPGGGNVDLMRYLIGDILAVDWRDVAVIWSGVLICGGVLIWRWQGLLMSSLDREMALAHGRNPRREGLLFTIALAVLVAVAIKVVGALLIGAMLIIPAAAARGLARSPEAMAVIAVVLGALSALVGITASAVLDTPAGPSIVSAAAGLYLLSLLLPSNR